MEICWKRLRAQPSASPIVEGKVLAYELVCGRNTIPGVLSEHLAEHGLALSDLGLDPDTLSRVRSCFGS